MFPALSRHELGYRHPFGCFLRYRLRDRRGRKLGCLLFEAGTTRLPCRDAWMGWRDRDRAKRLKGVVSNSRFLIFPWVRVPYLASKALSMAVRRLPGDWKERHGLEPVLAETFVDPAKYRGTCYRVANWQCIGRTKGRKANASEAGRTPKDVYLYPLTKDWKQVLLSGSRRSGRRSRRPPVAVLAPEDTLVRLWSDIVETLMGVAHRHDRLWRRRVLNTLVVVLFVFRLVFSKGRPGYATTLAELWGSAGRWGSHCHSRLRCRRPPSAVPGPSWTSSCSRPCTRQSSRWSSMLRPDPGTHGKSDPTRIGGGRSIGCLRSMEDP